MIDFLLLTTDPADLRDKLIARNIIEQYIDPEDGSTKLRGVRFGFEWTARHQIPPFDGKEVYLCRMAYDAADDDADGESETDVDDDGRLILRSKLVRFVKANGTRETLQHALLDEDGQPTGETIDMPTFRIGTKFWFAHPNALSQWAVWQ